MVAGEFGKEVVAEIIFGRCVFSIVGLERTHEILRVIRPQPGLFCVVVEITLKSLISLTRHGQIAGENVVERRNISGTLDGSVTTQCENSTARSADISKQQLQNCSGTNDLHSLGMLGPADCIANGGSPLRSRRSRKRMGDFVKKIRRNTADFLHHLRRVARKMPLQFLEHALRMLQCEISLRSA